MDTINKPDKAIAILGGTFDPVHNGHLEIAKNILHDFPFDKILFLPCYQPVHRDTPQASAEQRSKMLELALVNCQKCVIDDREIRRQGPSYMIDTLISLRNEFPEAILCLIIGMDVLLTLSTWKRWQELVNYAHVIVVNRPENSQNYNEDINRFLGKHLTQDKQDLFNQKSGKVYFYSMPPFAVSATNIRQKLQQQVNQITELPEAVLQYIKQQGIYR